MTHAIFLLGLDTHCVNVCVQYLYQCHLFLSTDVCLPPQSLTSSFVGEEVTLCLGCASLATEICVIIKQRYRLFSFNFAWERLGRKQQRPLQTKRSFNSMQLETFDKQPVCKWWVGWKCNKCFCCQYCILFFCSVHATKQILVHFEDLPGDIIPEMIIFQYFLMCLWITEV